MGEITVWMEIIYFFLKLYPSLYIYIASATLKKDCGVFGGGDVRYLFNFNLTIVFKLLRVVQLGVKRAD